MKKRKYNPAIHKLNMDQMDMNLTLAENSLQLGWQAARNYWKTERNRHLHNYAYYLEEAIKLI